MKTKEELFTTVKEQFDKDWAELQKNMEEEICGRKFSEIIDVTDGILADRKRRYEYDKMFEERSVFTSFNDFDLCIHTDRSIVSEYNRLYANLVQAFLDDGQCNMVKLTLNGGLKDFDRYLVTTDDLYGMTCFCFRTKILERRGSGLDFIDAEYKTIGFDEYWKLLTMIADEGNYEEDKRCGFVFFKSEKFYEELYDSVEGDDMLYVFKGFKKDDVKKEIEKERKLLKG